MDRELLRRRDNLITAGEGIIALEVWSILKIIMLMIFRFSEVFGDIKKDSEIPEAMIYIGTFIIVGTIIAVSLFIRIYTGRSAIAEGRGEKKGNGYVILTGVITLMDFADLVVNLMSFMQPEKGILETFAVFILDATAVFIQTDLIVSAIKIRKMTAPGKEGE
ncbi:MAG: hypothetical protein IJT91_04565 [Clostridia bacterium]|nr:hypothetical protein [Clostridia bacterium]